MKRRGTWRSGARKAGLKTFFKKSSLYGHFKNRKYRRKTKRNYKR